jgi:glycosyltransferase involved in cell wall biosynthesis
MFKHSDFLFFNNIILQNYYIEKLGFKKSLCFLFPNGTDTTNYRTLNPKSYKEITQRYSKYFLFIGNACVWHNIESIIYSFNSFCKLRKDYKLLIVGGSSSTKYYNYLKSLSKGNKKIIFKSKVKNSTAIKYINASKFVLIPSAVNRISPGSPLKLYDCCACGKPLIVQSGLFGYSDVVENYSLGMTVDFNRPSFAAKNISSFIDNIDYSKLSKHNRNVSNLFFDWDICYTKRIKSLINEI